MADIMDFKEELPQDGLSLSDMETSKTGLIRSAAVIANIEGLLGIQLPPITAASATLPQLDARVRVLEMRKRITGPPPVSSTTQASLAWRICRVRLQVLHDFVLTPQHCVSPYETMCPHEGPVSLKQLRDLVASIPHSNAPGVKWSSAVVLKPWLPEVEEADDVTLTEKEKDESDTIALVVQQLAFHIGTRSSTFAIEKLDRNSVYNIAVNTAINLEYWSSAPSSLPGPGMPRSMGPPGIVGPPGPVRRFGSVPGFALTPARPPPMPRPPIISPPPIWRSKKRNKRGRGRARSVSSSSSVSSDGSERSARPKRRWLTAPFRAVGRLFCWRRNVVDDASSVTTRSTIVD